MIHFIRLLRPINLVIILLTMCAMRWFFNYLLTESNPDFYVQGEVFDFVILVISTILIAGAGNIINDYFDVKADRINKPHRLIVTKHLKRRWAIVTHWIFNFIAFAIALHLSIKHQSFVYLFIHLLSINLLWFYSMYFKRKFVIGNVIIAGLTGLVPILVAIYFVNVFQLGSNQESWFESLVRIGQDYFAFNPSLQDISQLILNFGFAMGVFAFFTNLAREVIKDAEDVKGDLLLNARTIPIVLGRKKTDTIVSILLLFPALLFGGFIAFSSWLTPIEFIIVFAPIAIAIIFQLITLLVICTGKSEKKYRTANHLLKISMLAGLFTPVYLILI